MVDRFFIFQLHLLKTHAAQAFENIASVPTLEVDLVCDVDDSRSSYSTSAVKSAKKSLATIDYLSFSFRSTTEVPPNVIASEFVLGRC